MKLICLDDDRRMESTLRRFAGRLGHQVNFHSASLSFKADVKAQAPDLVVLDLVLGRESSIGIIAWLAQNQVRVPVLLLSGHGDEMLDAARRIAEANGIEVLGAINKGQIVRDLPPLLIEGDRAARQPEASPPAAETELTAARLGRYIRQGRIEPCFRPLLAPADGRLRGARVLPRLRLPSGTILNAPAILPLAESAGLTLALAESLFGRVLELKGRLAPMELDLVSVGLSVAALDRQPTIALMRILILVRTLIEGLADCCRVRVELTDECEPADTLPLSDSDAASGLLGATLAADDFGAGFSCVRSLAELPAETLMAGLCGLSPTEDAPRTHNLLLAGLALRHGLGLRWVVDGPQGDSGRRILLESGSDMVEDLRGRGPLDIHAFARTWGPSARRETVPSP